MFDTSLYVFHLFKKHFSLFWRLITERQECAAAAVLCKRHSDKLGGKIWFTLAGYDDGLCLLAVCGEKVHCCWRPAHALSPVIWLYGAMKLISPWPWTALPSAPLKAQVCAFWVHDRKGREGESWAVLCACACVWVWASAEGATSSGNYSTANWWRSKFRVTCWRGLLLLY